MNNSQYQDLYWVESRLLKKQFSQLSCEKERVTPFFLQTDKLKSCHPKGIAKTYKDTGTNFVENKTKQRFKGWQGSSVVECLPKD